MEQITAVAGPEAIGRLKVCSPVTLYRGLAKY
jgi:hypothetical protein